MEPEVNQSSETEGLSGTVWDESKPSRTEKRRKKTRYLSVRVESLRVPLSLDESITLFSPYTTHDPKQQFLCS